MGARLCVVALAGALLGSAAAAERIHLLADFDDKPVDQPIGAGGPELGEPVQVDMSPTAAVVRASPTPTPCLQLVDESDCCAQSVRFEFLDGAEISSGPLVIRADFWAPEQESSGYFLYVREKGGTAHDFVSLIVAGGDINVLDAGGFVGVVGTCPTGRPTTVRIALDMTAGTYDLSVDGQLMVDDQPHDVVGVGIGIGAVLVGVLHDPGTGDAYYLDRLFVADGDPTPAERATWGGVKARFRVPE
jgi:hypothetical protein